MSTSFCFPIRAVDWEFAAGLRATGTLVAERNLQRLLHLSIDFISRIMSLLPVSLQARVWGSFCHRRGKRFSIRLYENVPLDGDRSSTEFHATPKGIR